jgi:hypothetical protein
LNFPPKTRIEEETDKEGAQIKLGKVGSIDCSSCHPIFLDGRIIFHTVVMAADKRAAFWKRGKRAGGGGA